MKRAEGERRQTGKRYGKIENAEQQFRTPVCLDKAIEDGQQPKAAELNHGKILRITGGKQTVKQKRHTKTRCRNVRLITPNNTTLCNTNNQ